MYTILCAASLVELFTGEKSECIAFARNYARQNGMTNFKLVNNQTRKVRHFSITRFGFVL